jgi:hypothetical protein
MATYRVRPGDNLSKIARALSKKYGKSLGWRDLYEANRNLIKDPNLIYSGWNLNVPGVGGGGSTSTKKETTTLPSDEIIKTTTKGVETNREPFTERYGTLEELMPTAMFQAVGEERVNPEEMRKATEQVIGYDRGFGARGGYMSSALQQDRQNFLNELERARKTAVNSYVENQKQQYSDWYNQQVKNYQTSEAPTDFQLGKFGIEVPTGMETYSPDVRFEYRPAMDFSKVFRYGGYSAPNSMFNMPTPIST